MSESIAAWWSGGSPSTGVSAETRERAGQALQSVSGLEVYPSSIVASGGVLYFYGRSGSEKRLGLLAGDPGALGSFTGVATGVSFAGKDAQLKVCPANRANAAVLRRTLAYLNPQTLGLAKSAGLGDRLGLATPGHIKAIRAEAASKMQPIFAQQSMRENARTGRHPQDVMDDAMWGVFQEGWQEPWGADADHLKTLEDIDLCTECGYTFYTIDPGAHVDDRAVSMDAQALEAAFVALPWDVLESSPSDLLGALGDKHVDIGGENVFVTKAELVLAAVKYGRAVAHTRAMYERLVQRMGDKPFDLEVSVDETAQVTSIVEHIYIASELRRMGVKWVSMAPRYIGEFEKGVDYIGDLAAFEQDFARHTRVMQTYGPYKLSLHSGSDKFSIYPIASKVAGDLVHLKTAGTSYLEALRAISRADSELFRRIVRFALDRYETDRATYHVSAQGDLVEKALAAGGDLSGMLDDFHARQVLHVTFGSVLAQKDLSEPFFRALRANEALYDEVVDVHFRKHISPFRN